MKKIVGVLHPFDIKQNFYVYENGNQIDRVETTLDDLNETVLSLAEKHNIQQVDLTGPKQYNKGLVKKIQEAETARYNKNILEINVV